MKLPIASVPLLFVAFLLGCSATGSTPSGSGSSPDAGGASDGEDGGVATCHSLAHRDAPATAHKRTEAEPVPKGGSLRDGTFVLRSVTRYGLPSAEADTPFLQRVTLRLAADVAEIVATQTIAGKTREARSKGRVAVAGTQVTITDECPVARSEVFDFTASGDTLLLFGTFLGTRMVESFERVE